MYNYTCAPARLPRSAHVTIIMSASIARNDGDPRNEASI